MSIGSARIPSPTSITDELATVLSNDPGNMRLLSSLTPPCSILSTALSLGSAIAQIDPDLADKPSLHVLILAPDELLIDGGRWFQLAGDRLGRAHPIRVSVATLERFRFQSSEYADMLTHKSQAEIVDIDTCIHADAPDLIYMPLMRLPTSVSQLPKLTWIGTAMRKGIRVAGTALNALEASVIAACVHSSRAGAVRPLAQHHEFATGVGFEVVAQSDRQSDPQLAALAIEWIANLKTAAAAGRTGLLMFTRDAEAERSMRQVAAAAGEIGDRLVAAWTAFSTSDDSEADQGAGY